MPALAVAGMALAMAAASGFTWSDADGRLTLMENGKPVLVYQRAMTLADGAPDIKRRAGYVHPLYAPNGAVVTDDFPKDHWHHRGMFWAWQAVRYHGVEHDPWTLTGGIVTRVERTQAKSGAQAHLTAYSGWFFDEKRIVNETVRMQVEPLQGVARKIHFELTLEAVGDPVEIVGELANKKGYGGFSIRFAPRENTVVRTEKSAEAKDTDMVPHPWAELEATYAGKRAAVRIDDDPSNPGYPNGWCLRNYGFLGVNYPGLTPLKLEKGKPLQMRYTVTVRSVE